MFARLVEYSLKNIFWSVFLVLSFACFTLSPLVYVFEKGEPGANINGYLDSIWWGVVTMLTIGYGDRYPVTTEGRFFAFFLMSTGVFAMGILTARISSFFLERALKNRRGVVDERLLSEHLVICGWKTEMYEFLEYIMQTNPDLEPDQLVLVNNANEDLLKPILDSKLFFDIKIVTGDFFTKPVLKRASPERAKKILILADSAPDAGGKIPTVTEADARTIMAAITLNNIAKGVNVTAEIIDASMDQYLKIAQVNEIIYSRDYSRLLLAKASSGFGIPNIIHDLIDPGSTYKLDTRSIPSELTNISYEQFYDIFAQKYPNMNLIGFLENSGNSHNIKEQALKKAQQTPDIGQLVGNLQSVKDIKFNHPVFSPPKDYIVPEGALAIVIENKHHQVEQYDKAA